MKPAQLLAISIIMSGCGAAVSETSSAIGTTPASQSATAVPGSPSATASPTPVEARGRFVYLPGTMDCPDGCPSYSIPEAIALPRSPGGPILVNGYLLIEPDGSGWYCETLTDSVPPHCAGDRLAFDGLDFLGQLAVEELTEELDGVRWSEGLQLLGEVAP